MPTAQPNGGIKFVSGTQAIPGFFTRFLAASARVGLGQFATVAPATGYASLADGTVPLQISAGIGDFAELSDMSTTAGLAQARLTDRMCSGLPGPAAGGGDNFTDADFGVPFYIKDENTPGKLSNSGGSNRSLGGLVFGLAIEDGGATPTPILWAGPVAHLVARATLVTQALIGGWFGHVVDAMASTTTAEKTMFRTQVHGVITGVRITSMGTLAADNTDYVTINVYKADGAGGTHVLVASYDSRAANQGALAAGVPKAFALSAVAGAINLLETDILTYEVAKAGAGKVVPVSTIEVVQKAI